MQYSKSKVVSTVLSFSILLPNLNMAEKIQNYNYVNLHNS